MRSFKKSCLSISLVTNFTMDGVCLQYIRWSETYLPLIFKIKAPIYILFFLFHKQNELEIIKLHIWHFNIHTSSSTPYFPQKCHFAQIPHLMVPGLKSNLEHWHSPPMCHLCSVLQLVITSPFLHSQAKTMQPSSHGMFRKDFMIKKFRLLWRDVLLCRIRVLISYFATNLKWSLSFKKLNVQHKIDA